MFLSNFHMHKKKILNCNIREISNQQEPKESTSVYRKKGQTGDSNLLQYGSSQQLLFAEKSPHTKQLKTAFLLKQKHFYRLMLNQYSHLDSHASHHELCCKVGNKTHGHLWAHSCQTTHVFASSTSTRAPCRLIATLLYLSTENPEIKSPKLKNVKDSRAVSNFKIPRQLLPLILMGSP